MDSKLVVEQMTGNWKIKHPDMKPLAMEANRLAPFGTTYTWVPREQNKHADRLANEALDGAAVRGHLPRWTRTTRPDPTSRLAGRGGRESRAAAVVQEEVAGYRGWSPPEGPVTTLVLVRHGATVAHRRQALLRRAGEQQPGPHRRGPCPGPRGRRLAGAARRARSTRWSPRRYAGPASRRRSSPSGSASTWSRSPASRRWSSASGTG